MTSKRCQNEIKEWSNTMKDNLVFAVYFQTFFCRVYDKKKPTRQELGLKCSAWKRLWS